MTTSKEIPLPKAIFFLLLTTFVVSGFGYLSIQAYFKKEPRKAKPVSNTITTIIQTGPKREALRTAYLAELLNLSQDKPASSLDFDLKRAQERLLRSPVIKSAEVRLTGPETLYIAYAVREPIARLYDISNAALDEEGVLFPLSPFFAPKILPEIYLGLNPSAEIQWNMRVSSPHFKLASDLLRLLLAAPYRDLFSVKRIDVSKATEQSFGRREIVLLIEERFGKKESKQIFLRLTPKNMLQELGNYLALRKQLAATQDLKSPLVIDLRIPQLGFVR